MTKKRKSRVGSSFGDYLAKEGIREEVENLALREVIADQLAAAMRKNGIAL
jgi:hypothetical protein